MEFDQNRSEPCSNDCLRLQYTGESRNFGPREKFTILPFRRSPCRNFTDHSSKSVPTRRSRKVIKNSYILSDFWCIEDVVMTFESRGVEFIYIMRANACGCDHTSTNAPDPIKTPKLSVLGRE